MFRFLLRRLLVAIPTLLLVVTASFFMMRAAVLPLVGYLGPATAGVITGSLVVERIFGMPGLGKFFVLSALQRDYTVVLGVVILYATMVMLLNLAAEVVQAMLDPRIRLS